MKVLVISHSLVLESTHARWRILAERYGTEVHLAVPAKWRYSWFGSNRSILAKPIKNHYFEVHPLSVWQRGSSLTFAFKAGLRKLLAIDPDVVYLAQDWNSLALQQVIAVLELVRPRTVTWGFSSYMEQINPPSWRSRWLWQRFCHRISRVKTYSQIGARVLRESGYLGAIDVETEIGVDLKEFRPDAEVRESIRERLALRGFVIGFAGRLVEEKGVRDLLETCASLEGEWNLLIIGDGPLRGELETAAGEGGLAGRVRFTGYVPHAEVPPFLQACDTLVLPSKMGQNRFVEQFGLVLAQAMACGVPVVGSDNGAIPEVIDDPGRVFPAGDTVALGVILKKMQRDTIYRKESSRVDIDRVSRLYSASALADSFQNSLLEHVGKNGKK